MRNLFPVSKTLAFRLEPVGKTLENIKKTNPKGSVIGNAEQLDKDYNTVKDLADRFHRELIEKDLSGLRLKYLSDGSGDSIQEYAELYYTAIPKNSDKDEKKKKEAGLERISANLKKQVSSSFDRVSYGGEKLLNVLAGKDFFKTVLQNYDKAPEEKARAATQIALTYLNELYRGKAVFTAEGENQ